MRADASERLLDELLAIAYQPPRTAGDPRGEQGIEPEGSTAASGAG